MLVWWIIVIPSLFWIEKNSRILIQEFWYSGSSHANGEDREISLGLYACNLEKKFHLCWLSMIWFALFLKTTGILTFLLHCDTNLVYLWLSMIWFTLFLKTTGILTFLLHCDINLVYLWFWQIGSSGSCIMSSCVKPVIRSNSNPVVLLHCFDRFVVYESHTNTPWLWNSYFLLSLIPSIVLLSSCLEWRCTYPLLEEAGLEAWAVDVLGWGFSDLGSFI